jgi:short subunit fatty acids transporter
MSQSWILRDLKLKWRIETRQSLFRWMQPLIVSMILIISLNQPNFKHLITWIILNNKESKEKVHPHLCNLDKEIVNNWKKKKKKLNRTTHLILFHNSQVKNMRQPILKIRHKYKFKDSPSKIITNNLNKALQWSKTLEISFLNDL